MEVSDQFHVPEALPQGKTHGICSAGATAGLDA